MPPPPKATRQEIERLLDVFGGSVAAVADQVGLHVSVLYRKFKQWGTDLGAYRRCEREFGSDGVRTVRAYGTARVEVVVSSLSHISHNEPSLSKSEPSQCFACPEGGSGPSLDGMIHGAQATSGAVLELGADSRKSNPARLPRELQDEIQQLRLAYQAKVGREFTNTDILAELVRKYIGAYRAELLAEPKETTR